MTNDRPPSDPIPEQPRSEPEILPPQRAGAGPRSDGPQPGAEGVWYRFEQRDGTGRVFVGRPGFGRIVLTLLAASLVIALVVLLLVGLALIWIPLAIVGVLLAMVSGAFRQKIAGLRARWGRRS